jgi:hypothetical protein
MTPWKTSLAKHIGDAMNARLDRRQFLSGTAALLGANWWSSLSAEPPRRPRVAAIFTEFRFRSHAYNILENSIRPYLFNGELVDPGIDVVSMYADQFPEGDMAREVSQRFNIPLFPTIEGALTLGTGNLAVDAVLAIVEHGKYPTNHRGVVMYPRKEFFDQAVCVMQRAGRFVPYFNDKHLSYRWDWSKEMYDVARSCGMPLMAGSSVPLAQRRPAWELPANAEIEEAVAIHGGSVEGYDFHGLELLQSIVEARRGGESGICSVEFLEGESLAHAADQGRWSRELAEAAMQSERALNEGVRGKGKNLGTGEIPSTPAHGLLLRYRDGLRATVLKIGTSSNRWNFACRLKGNPQIHSTAFFNGPWGNRNLFKALSHAIQHFFRSGCAPYPVERTLLVSGVLEGAMWSRELGGCRINTPNLSWNYPAQDFASFRETGASWKVLTHATPEVTSFDPGDAALMKPTQ